VPTAALADFLGIVRSLVIQPDEFIARAVSGDDEFVQPVLKRRRQAKADTTGMIRPAGCPRRLRRPS